MKEKLVACLFCCFGCSGSPSSMSAALCSVQTLFTRVLFLESTFPYPRAMGRHFPVSATQQILLTEFLSLNFAQVSESL